MQATFFDLFDAPKPLAAGVVIPFKAPTPPTLTTAKAEAKEIKTLLDLASAPQGRSDAETAPTPAPIVEAPQRPPRAASEAFRRVCAKINTKAHHRAAERPETDEDADALANTGRTANKAAARHQLSASKLCQYFTPNDLAAAIVEQAGMWTDYAGRTLTVFDPTCGTGRLLFPWKRAGHAVLGVELDADAAKSARHLIGAANVAVGDLMEYRDHARNVADIVVTNPPFGMDWEIEDGDRHRYAIPYSVEAKTVSSELATMRAALDALQGGEEGMIFAILPERFAGSPRYREMLDRADGVLLADFAIRNAFAREYKIDVTVRLQVIRTWNKYRHNYDDAPKNPPVKAEIDYAALTWQSDLARAFWQIETPEIAWAESAPDKIIPDISRLTTEDVDRAVTIGASGPCGSPQVAAWLAFLDATTTAYDPVRGIQSGAITAKASRVNILQQGTQPAEDFLRAAGFDVTPPTPAEAKAIQKARARFDWLGTPIQPVKAHDRLSYFMDRTYQAAHTVKDDDGATVWTEGKAYSVRPGWIRESHQTGQTRKGEGKKAFTEIQRREAGYLQITVQTDAEPYTVDERDAATVGRFVDAFGLPEVADVATKYPAQTEAYRAQAAERFPFLFDYQQADLAALATKPAAYLGYEMGGGKTVSGAVWAALRHYRRVLVVTESGLVQNWLAELKKFGFNVHELRSHAAVSRLAAQVAETKKSDTKAGDGSTFYVTSYEFLSLGNKTYDPWTCYRPADETRAEHECSGNTGGSCRDCGRDFLTAVPECPKCGNADKWTGFCHKCGYRAFAYSGGKSYPAIKRIRKLFGAVLVDEAQAIKSKLSLRGQAVRSIKSKGKLVLTGTLLKGFVTDLYWTVAWLLGHDTPLFPYPYRAGSKRFLDEFATYDFVDRQFEDTLSKGRAKLIPEISNLNRFRRILAPMMVRRTKSDMPELAALPPKHRHVESLALDDDHQALYDFIAAQAEEAITTEFRLAAGANREINMGIISRALWQMHYAATEPTAAEHVPGALPKGTDTAKLHRIREILADAKASGEKVLIFSGLRDMQRVIAEDAKAHGFGVTEIFSEMPTKRRLEIVNAFQKNADKTAIVTGLEVLNRGFTITAASRVIITDIGYTPEPHRQAEDRVHRPGQTRPVHVHYLFGGGTIDEHIYAVTEAKQQAIDAAIDGKVRTKTAAILEAACGNVKLAVARMIAERT